jgi:hypothetical protein
MLLLHNLVQTRAKSLTEILQGRAVAMVASRAESENGTRGRKRGAAPDEAA